jgi:hypothetical protein
MVHTTSAGRAVRVLLLLTVWAWVGACREEPGLTGSSGRLRLSEERVDFPATLVGKQREATVRVLNAGRTPLDVTWTQVGAPFTVEGLPRRVDGTEVELRVRYTPTGAGPHEAVLTGSETGGGQVTLRLEGRGLEVPACPTPVGCHRFTFDMAQEKCVEETLADGTPCDAGNACLTDTVCQAGVCEGREKTCDDGNACTTDVCNPLDGCQSVPAPPCPGDGACRVGTCDPKAGCGLAPAPDGTLCGEGTKRGCDDAQVCISGACVTRNLPDGFVCAPATPCQGEGRCAGPVCARPEPTPLQVDWSYDASTEGRGLHDFLVGPTGDVTLAGFFENIVIDAAGPVPVRSGLAPRRCMLWNERLLCMDVPASGQVSLMERATGVPRWTFDLGKERPDLASRVTTLFMARLAVMAPDRLAALFEGYPAGMGSESQCRVYFLVVLDAVGRMVSATELTDPLLSECNHPHPFGLASDTAGDLYVTFSQTLNTGAPLAPGAPPLLMAFSSDGVERWRRTEGFNGGELAVVKGLLVPEKSPSAFSTRDGAPVGSFGPGGAGRVVATSHVLVSSPENATVNPGVEPVSTRMEAYGLAGLGPSWRYTLPSGWNFTSKEIRLAGWPAGKGLPSETLVLGFASDARVPALVGVRAKDGSEAFRCELGYGPRSLPQLMELGPGSLVVMDGATSCGECDPPFAYSRARFQRFPMPGLTPANEPWPGTFGGPGHDHHEDPVYAAPNTSPSLSGSAGGTK